MMWNCPRCGRENAADVAFCGRCGLEIAKVNRESQVESSEPCYRHPKESTILRCGKCDRPICHRCVVMSPAGTRCRECSRSGTPVRIRGVIRDIGVSIGSIFRYGPLGYILAFVIVGLLFGSFRMCSRDRIDSRDYEYVPVEAPAEP